MAGIGLGARHHRDPAALCAVTRTRCWSGASPGVGAVGRRRNCRSRDDDYPGLGTPGTHPYLIGASEGRAVLDALRAARSVVDDTTKTIAIYGHSQGAHAVLYAAELAPSYAPELDLVGAAAMAPPTDLGDLVNRDVNEPLGIILTSLAVTSWSTLYPDKVDVATIVHEEARPSVAGIGDRCIGTIGDGTGQAVADLPEVAALEARFLSADPATAAGWSTMLEDNSGSGVTIEVPLLVAQGLADELVRPNTTDSFVTQQCDDGAAVDYRTYPGVGHFQVRAVAASAVADWLLDRMQGDPLPVGCTRTTA